MATYLLLFSPDGRSSETFTVPDKKVVYLVRAEAASSGTATVQDLLSLTNYEFEDGETILDTGIEPGTQVSLTFLQRSNKALHSINAEVTDRRG